MARKAKGTRYKIALNDGEEAVLREMMREDMKEEVSGYIGYLITEVYKYRQANRKGKVGRPPREEGVAQDEERTIPHPDQDMNPGGMMTRSEYEAYMAIRAGTLRSE